MYDFALDNKPLKPDDAHIVQVIHTDMLQAGAPIKSGTIDFYPNGGGVNGIQPGCPIFDTANTFNPLSKLGLFRLFGELVVVVCLVGCLD
jgi:hypothetical protein